MNSMMTVRAGRAARDATKMRIARVGATTTTTMHLGAEEESHTVVE